jgi:hypothetical protein
MRLLQNKGGNNLSLEDHFQLEENEKLINELRLIEDKFYKVFDLNPCPMAIHKIDDNSLIDVNNAFLKVVEAKSKFDLIGKNTTESGLKLMKSKDIKLFFGKLKDDGIFENYLFSFRTLKGKKLRGMVSGTIIELNGVKCLLSICQIINRKCLTRIFKTMFLF